MPHTTTFPVGSDATHNQSGIIELTEGSPAPRLSPQEQLRDFQERMELLRGKQGKAYWRGLEELADTPQFDEVLQREFPRGAAEWLDPISRRNFLKLMGASLALAGVTACTRQADEYILPYTNAPVGLLPGVPSYYATAMPLGGLTTGLLAKSVMGRPIKLEGNPKHPASLGATDLLAQASILTFYDPERSQVVFNGSNQSTWANFVTNIGPQMEQIKAANGTGLAFLTEATSSPTFAALMERLLADLPNATWYQYEPLARDNAFRASELAFGQQVLPKYDFTKADVVLSLDADFLNGGVAWVRYAHDYATRRRIWEGELSRLYVIEATPSATGTMADHRIAARPSEVEAMARLIAQQLGLNVPQVSGFTPTEKQGKVIAGLVSDLQAKRGSSIVIAGDEQPPAVHMLAFAINEALGNVGSTVEYIETPLVQPSHNFEGIKELSDAMGRGAVRMLVIIGANPVFTAPADLDFGAKLAQVPFSVHMGLYRDETGQAVTWHIPETHFLETWSDGRAYDGTTTIMQPLIAPLFNARSPIELLSVLRGVDLPSIDLIRNQWGVPANDRFNTFWQTTLNEGIVADSEAEPVNVAVDLGSLPPPPTINTGSFEVVFRPDPTLYDGRFANNGWLQEVPKPLTKITWDNPALVSPRTAVALLNIPVSDVANLKPEDYEKLSAANGRMLDINYGGRVLRVPLWVTPGHPDNAVTLYVGSGHTAMGVIANGTGFNTYSIRTSDAPWFGPATVTATAEQYKLVSTQMHHSMEGRAIVRVGTLDRYRENPEFVKDLAEFNENLKKSLFTGEWVYNGHAWGMTIDLNTCTGCNACLVACQAENNIPIVGKSEVAVGREMHWIRIDRYYGGTLEDPMMYFQPMACVHCEKAPCELVCPVAATVHSHEGINSMVYNRCVGTKYCSNNCPYKVRRFNFLQYVDETTPSFKLMRNPEVTVRSRGVMEKCTYCQQRISAVGQAAKVENRPIAANEIKTACQQVCPTGAIVFGDINNPEDTVTAMKKIPLNYAVLGELNVVPRTTYLGRLVNFNPEIGGDIGITYFVEQHHGHGDEHHGDEHGGHSK